jgi:hypothetical protein
LHVLGLLWRVRASGNQGAYECAVQCWRMMRVDGDVREDICDLFDKVDDVLLVLNELLELRADQLVT